MELTIALAISIIGVVITVMNFSLSRRDKSMKETQDTVREFSKHDLIEYRLNKIEQNLEKILNKLDTYDKEIEKKISDAMKRHITEFHK